MADGGRERGGESDGGGRRGDEPLLLAHFLAGTACIVGGEETVVARNALKHLHHLLPAPARSFRARPFAHTPRYYFSICRPWQSLLRQQTVAGMLGAKPWQEPSTAALQAVDRQMRHLSEILARIFARALRVCFYGPEQGSRYLRQQRHGGSFTHPHRHRRKELARKSFDGGVRTATAAKSKASLDASRRQDGAAERASGRGGYLEDAGATMRVMAARNVGEPLEEPLDSAHRLDDVAPILSSSCSTPAQGRRGACSLASRCFTAVAASVASVKASIAVFHTVLQLVLLLLLLVRTCSINLRVFDELAVTVEGG